MALLTAQQKLDLKAAINAETDATFVSYRTAGSTGLMAQWLNGASTTNVWKTRVGVNDIMDAINWSLYTPVDTIDGTATFTNRMLAIQTKQMNLQSMLFRDTIDMSKATLRNGLRDAVIQVPAGASGANVSPGGSSGATVLAVCVRPATKFEAIFATTSATTGSTTANILVVEGTCTDSNVVEALNS